MALVDYQCNTRTEGLPCFKKMCHPIAIRLPQQLLPKVTISSLQYQRMFNINCLHIREKKREMFVAAKFLQLKHPTCRLTMTVPSPVILLHHEAVEVWRNDLTFALGLVAISWLYINCDSLIRQFGCFHWQEYCHKLNPDSIRFNSLFFASSLQAIRLRVCRQSWRIREGDTDLPGHLWSSTKLFPLFFCRVKCANTTGYWRASLYAVQCLVHLAKNSCSIYRIWHIFGQSWQNLLSKTWVLRAMRPSFSIKARTVPSRRWLF